ncbi:YegP family protein [Arthrobacter sp. H14-L1]|uniref:YegP family protein n=1 Tax=Arthrobacter sp. H14-L1 TaxID=2996697 RepID=UPI0022708418|nr:DUF1508 domain-containing protein [Arthrobacter sp. H14-L1]MCY0903643.1 DUF1508 domain-containing protein [Arthrobacter sp. H14-L1]
MAGKFELHRDKSGGCRFRLKAGYGEIIASSESYKTKAGALGSPFNVSAWASPLRPSYWRRLGRGWRLGSLVGIAAREERPLHVLRRCLDGAGHRRDLDVLRDDAPLGDPRAH